MSTCSKFLFHFVFLAGVELISATLVENLATFAAVSAEIYSVECSRVDFSGGELSGSDITGLCQ